MKKLLQYSFLFFTFNISSQVPNGNFEYWTNGNPDYWQTTNIPIAPPSIIIQSDVHSGLYSTMGIVVMNSHSQPFPPYLANCGPTANGFPVFQKYASLSLWGKVFLNPDDRFIGKISMYNSDQAAIAEGNLMIDYSISSWTKFTVDLIYTTDDVPVSCALFFTLTDATQLASAQVGSYFIIDDLNLSGVVGVEEEQMEAGINVFPNPATDKIHLSMPAFSNQCSYTLQDINGKLISEKSDCGKDEVINIETLPAGIYFLNAVIDNRRTVNKIVVN